jgi:hypothetical protein
MMVAHALRTTAVLAVVWVAHSACDWQDLDAIVPLPGGGDDGAYDVETVVNGSEDGQQAVDADAQTRDATSAGDGTNAADTSDGMAGDVATVPTCGSTNSQVTKQWTFDATTEGWKVEDGAGMTILWNDTVGWPTSGALEVDSAVNSSDAASNQAYIGFDESPSADLSGRTVSAWLWLDSGTSPDIKLFVQTGNIYTWADGGSFVLAAHTWRCVSLDVSSPEYVSQNGVYDPTDVLRIGFELDGAGPYRLYVDSVSY